MLAKDLMRRDVFTVRGDQPIGELIDLMVREHIHGCPVVDEQDRLVGVVTQQDIFFSEVTRAAGSGQREAPESVTATKLKVRDLMTSPAVSVTEDAEVLELCRMMHRLRIHRIPVVRDGKVAGIISSLDIIREVARGPERL